jgi:hypothetical protein
MHDSLALTHFLSRHGVEPKAARDVGGIVDRIAERLKLDEADFLAPFSDSKAEALREAWKASTGQDIEPIVIVARDLRDMLPGPSEALFALADDRTVQAQLDLSHPDLKPHLEYVAGPTGTELVHPDGQPLLHAIRVSLGDKGPEPLLAKRYGNSYARIICRHVKHVLYLHAVNVLLGKSEAAAATKPLAECLPFALPLAHGTFTQDETDKTGPIFLVCRRSAT